MRVMVLGLRGFPGIQGGVETHAEKLYPILRDKGCDIEVIVRSPYWRAIADNSLSGIRFRPIWSPSSTGVEAFVHTFLGVLYAGWRRPDVLHIHAIGPALFVPLAKLLGLRVVVTHHGPDYDREKWSGAAKFILRIGERLGVLFSDERIVISNVIRELVEVKYGRGSTCIPNGVEIPTGMYGDGTLQALGLQAGRYILNVSRMVPEKRHLDLIEAFPHVGLPGWKLVLVGDLTADDAYVREVVAAAGRSSSIVLAGFQTGQALAEIYANAGVFALPSTHEGLPIALLEALSYGLPSVASNIPANKEVDLPSDQYFRVNDVRDLAACLYRVATAKRAADFRETTQAGVGRKYDWQSIAQRTLEVYRRVCGQDRHTAPSPMAEGASAANTEASHSAEGGTPLASARGP